jgi:hypothetical protein
VVQQLEGDVEVCRIRENSFHCVSPRYDLMRCR